jgi:hypothetical protein
MKKFLMVILFITLTPCICLGESIITLSPVDNTKKWKYPYEVDAGRANDLINGIGRLADLTARKNSVINCNDAINLLGAPDMVTDLERPYAGLSSKDDEYIASNKTELKWRLVWFLKRNNKVPGSGDIWIGVYIKKDSDQIIKFIIN